MVKNGNKLVFDQDSSGKDTSYIQSKRTNEKIWLRQENGVCVLDLMVAPPRKRAMIEALIRIFTGRDSVHRRLLARLKPSSGRSFHSCASMMCLKG